MAPPQKLGGHEPVVAASIQCLDDFTGRGGSFCSMVPQKKEINLVFGAQLEPCFSWPDLCHPLLPLDTRVLQGDWDNPGQSIRNGERSGRMKM